MKDVITVDGEKYQRIGTEKERLMIICVDNRGLMFVGRVDLSGKGEFVTIRNARCVIYWGTENHVAELVSGPKSKTKLGAAADVKILRKNMVFAYACDKEGWKNHVN